MARKKKLSVDYFPHFVGRGKTIQILQNRYGIKGYAFWFKLLEALSASDNIYLSWDKPIEREYFTADAGVSVSEAKEIIEVLANLGNIDAELWHDKHIIWCQGLVDNLADIWQKRKQKTPEKPEKKESDSSKKTGYSSEKNEKNDPKTGYSSEKNEKNVQKETFLERKERNERKDTKESKENKKERKVSKRVGQTDRPTHPPAHQRNRACRF